MSFLEMGSSILVPLPSFTFFSLKFFLSHLHKLLRFYERMLNSNILFYNIVENLVIIRLGRVILIEDLITKWPLFTVYTYACLRSDQKCEGSSDSTSLLFLFWSVALSGACTFITDFLAA
mmetsp:Transcript_35053/g.59334  ORF Transcript_35053/g.59334 Transcript_35053/m.59334 type:complete len:120 (-) Transcript_35053:1754-2113(-)